MKVSRILSCALTFVLAGAVLTACFGRGGDRDPLPPGEPAGSPSASEPGEPEPQVPGPEEPEPGSEPQEPAPGPEEPEPEEPAPGLEQSEPEQPEPEPEQPEPEPEKPEPEPEKPGPEPGKPEPEPEQPEPEKENHTLYVLMYHDIVEDGRPYNNWTITTSRLREDFQWLKDNGYVSLLPSELASGKPLPPKAVLITFDDGYKSNYTLGFPIMKELGTKCAVALITNNQAVGNPGSLTWDMCREMRDSGLVEFGSHTHNLHLRDLEGAGREGLCRMEGESRTDYEARVLTDLQTSCDLMEENLGVPPRYFAYPHGLTDSWSDDWIARHFDVTVITRHGPADITGGLYKLPRHNISVEHPASEYLP